MAEDGEVEPPSALRPQLRLDELLQELQHQVTAVIGVRDRMHRLLDAVVAISSDLDLEEVLNRLVRVAAELVDARYGALRVLDVGGDTLPQFVYYGVGEQTAEAIGPTPCGDDGVLGVLIQHPSSLRLHDLTTHPEWRGFPPGHPPMRSFLGVPVRARGKVFGHLYLTEKQAGEEFDETDENVVVALAAAAGVSVEIALLSEESRQLAVYEERDRIARNLHDLVIQRLFATGMSLQNVAGMVGVDPATAEARLATAVDDIDDTIREIRSTIYRLQEPTRPHTGLRARLLGVVTEQVQALGFEPAVSFEGLVDTGVPDIVSEHLVAVLAEALANIAKHAQAHSAFVTLTVRDDVMLVVRDDGVGLPDGGRRSGLANLAARAESLHGSFTASRDDTGTVLRWWVPLSVP